MNVTITDTATPMLKRLGAAAQNLAPAVHEAGDLIATRLRDRLTKLPVPWRKAATQPKVTTSFTAQSALVSADVPASAPTPMDAGDTAAVTDILARRIAAAIGAGA